MFRALLAGVLFAIALCDALVGAARPPRVASVDPPSWWIRHSLNPIRILVRGDALTNAAIDSDDPALVVSAVRTSASGHYAFADVSIGPTTRTGTHTFRLSTPGGSAGISFTLAPPLDHDGRAQGFTSDDVIYLAMTDRFADGDPSNDDPAVSRGLFDRTKPRYYHGGDLRGVTAKLPYLKDLGVTAIWLTPWYDNVDHLNYKETYDGQPIADYHGYGAVDFYRVDEHLGTLDDVRAFVAEAHRLGLKVIQDQVANHTGPYHPWVQDPPTPTWFNGTAAHHLTETWQIWTLQDPHAAPSLTASTLDGWFLDILPDINQRDDDAALYVIQNALWWSGVAAIDGVRQDTLPYVPRAFWSRWSTALHREFPTLRIVGELLDMDPALVSYFAGGVTRADGIDTGIDSLFDFPLMGASREAFAKGKTVRSLAQTLAHDHLYPDPMRLVTLLGNHDVPRFMGEPGATTAGLELAQTFLLTTRGIPQLYYGDEIALPGGGDPDNRRSIPGAFAGDARDAFTGAGRTASEQHVFDHLALLLHLRQELEPLRRGNLRQLYVADQQYVYARSSGSQAVVVAINNDTAPATWRADVSVLQLADGAELTDRLGTSSAVRVDGGGIAITLPARSAAIYVRK